MKTKKVTSTFTGSSAILIGIALQTFYAGTALAAGNIPGSIALQGVLRATSTTFVPDGTTYCANVTITDTTNAQTILASTNFNNFTTSSGAFTLNIPITALSMDKLTSTSDVVSATVKVDYTGACSVWTDTFTGIQLYTVPYAGVAGLAGGLSSSATVPFSQLGSSASTGYLYSNGSAWSFTTPTVSGVTASSSAPVIAGTSSTTVGNTTASTAVTIEAGTGGTISIDASSGNNTAVNIATGTSTGSLSMGNTSGATTITGTTVGLNGTTTVTGVTSIVGNTSINNAAGTNTTTIGGSTGTGAIAIGNGTGAQNVTIGGSSGTGTIAIGGSSGNQPVTIGSTAGAITIGAGGASTGAITIGQGTSTQTTTIGGSSGTGAITIGNSSAAQNVTIGGSGTGSVTIGSSSTGAVNLGQALAGQTITIGSANTSGTNTVNIGVSGTGTGAETVNIASGAGTGALALKFGPNAAFTGGFTQCTLATLATSATQVVTGCTGIPATASSGWNCQCSLNVGANAAITTVPATDYILYSKAGYSAATTLTAGDVFVTLNAAITTAGNEQLSCFCAK